jgi:GNAT superfamily N-acetyltransferase
MMPSKIVFDLVVTDMPPPSLRDELGGGISAFNVARLGPADMRPLAILIRSQHDEVTIGGLLGRTSFRRLFIELLFVPESLRGQGVGRDLLQKAEVEAKTRGCLGVWLETFSADAHRFYEANGYRTFGEIADYPPGNTRYFLSKAWEG